MRRFLIYLFFLGFLGCKEKAEIEKISIPEGLEAVGYGENSKELCLSCSKKLIVYLNLEINSMYLFGMNPDFWTDMRDKYPEIGVVCVLAGKNAEKKRDRNYVIRSLEEARFPFQVLYDPENRFFEMNGLQQGINPKSSLKFFFTKDDVYFSSPQVGIPELFQGQVEEFLKE
ncbi:hypothetical protein Aoki45_29280 [Algoriphagus sp. oki45]|uniref:hypothetical protein n=1 Tax=Algoriphagus sp. oki45 TaxID=3067294 RepID=UPI0027FBD9ED|nr:hypothetical protein Aoki45_29280 [Algoriphagus sp. oki45]